MRKIYACLLLLLLTPFLSSAQAPYIATAGGDGLGQYGYLEKDAVTFSRLERNTYNNIAYLSARWWITDNDAANGEGKEYIYHVYDGPDWISSIGWQCGGDNYPSKRTTDFNVLDFNPEWKAGSDCYVSVCAKYCDDSYSPAGFNGLTTNGATGFNERHFRVLDVDTGLHVSTASYIGNANGVCQINNSNNVAGSFAIDPGGFAGITLTSLMLKNSGSAVEGTDIPNDALNVYYETAATGAEVFGDGNETFAGTLTGDWDGNSTDNIYGSTSINIPLTGKIRVYVLLCQYNSPAAIGKIINLGIVNDGIFLSPALDGFTKLRINEGSISQRNIILPVRFLQFSGKRNKGMVDLKWQVNADDEPAYFIVQQSFDGINFTTAGNRLFSDFARQRNHYEYTLNTAATYFRITAEYATGFKNASNIIRVKNDFKGQLNILQNPVTDNIIIQSSGTGNYNMRLTDASGKLIMNKNILFRAGANTILIPEATPSQLLFLQLQNNEGALYDFKIFKH